MAKWKVQETTPLRALKWVSLGSLIFTIAAVALQLPLYEIVAPWLFLIFLVSYIMYAVLYSRAAREAKRAAQELGG